MVNKTSLCDNLANKFFGVISVLIDRSILKIKQSGKKKTLFLVLKMEINYKDMIKFSPKQRNMSHEFIVINNKILPLFKITLDKNDNKPKFEKFFPDIVLSNNFYPNTNLSTNFDVNRMLVKA